MISIVETWLAGIPWPGILRLVVDISVKGALICSIAGVTTLLMHRCSASLRNMIWVIALAALVLLPALSFIGPVWTVPLLPGLDSLTSASGLQGEAAKEIEGPFEEAQTGAGTGAAEARSGFGAADLHWSAFVFLAWIGGAVMCLSWYLISRFGLNRILRRAEPVGDSWNRLQGEISSELGLRRSVRLLKSDMIGAAVTIGIFNPAVVLPSNTEGWPECRKRLMLSHELAHVKRRDGCIELLAVCAAVLYWFNPFVWLAVKRHRVERERDCDDCVLITGGKPSDYAGLLMDIAAELGGSGNPVMKLAAISQGSNLKDRLMSILNPSINRKRGGRRAAYLIGIVAAAVVLQLSVFGLWETKAQEKKEKKDKEKCEEVEKAEKLKKMQVNREEKVKQSWMKIAENENSAAYHVGKAIKKSGIEAGMDTYKKLKTAGGDYYFKESEFNTLGYLFLMNDKHKEAIAVFELNVKAYPDSWNVYDSLGEAYAHAGKFDKAIKYYEKSVKLNPENENGMKMIQKIKEKGEKVKKSKKT